MQNMKALDPQIPVEVRKLIDQRLDAIEREHDVRILFAVESGSRAWGFPSPDSDFDVRFVYVHRLNWYLSIGPRRDVVELPLEGDLDINGWDLKKALQLLIKPNPVLLEWLRSPVVYRVDGSAKDKIAALGEHSAHLRPSTHHYLRLAESQYRRFIKAKKTVPLKKYLYALRPVLALMWMRAHPDKPVPMSLFELWKGIEVPPQITEFVAQLLQRKATSKELGYGPRVGILDAMIEREINSTRSQLDKLPPVDHDMLDAANAVFLDLLGVQA